LRFRIAGIGYGRYLTRQEGRYKAIWKRGFKRASRLSTKDQEVVNKEVSLSYLVGDVVLCVNSHTHTLTHSNTHTLTRSHTLTHSLSYLVGDVVFRVEEQYHVCLFQGPPFGVWRLGFGVWR